MDDPLIGHQLGNYRLDRLIGSGGMASVYYAMDVRLNRPAAVKVIGAHLRDKGSYTERFVQEARAVAAWRHEHIIQIYYAGDEEGLFYFAMEYIDGTTLAQILADQEVAGQLLSASEVLRYGRAIASALDYAHLKGVIHRDVKPLNVLVGSDGRVVLTDFGLVLDTTQGSLGEVFGSAHYTAPEQARRSNAAVPQSDLYSLGIILYEMLTGVVPFDDPSPTSVALQHITLAPPAPRSLNPALSEAVESVLLRALSKNPDERYPTGKALMDALDAALQAPPADQSSELPASVASDSIPEQTAPLAAPIYAATGTPEQELPSPRVPVSLRSRSSNKVFWVGGSASCLVLIGIMAVAAFSLKGLLFARNSGRTVLPSSTSVIRSPSTPTRTGLAPVSSSTATRPAASATLSSSPTRAPSKVPPSNPPVTPTLPPSEEVVQISATPQPTPTLVPPSPTPTLKYTDRRRFKMFYNATSFYILQLSGVGDLIAGVAFERLDAQGNPLNRFSGNQWAKYSASSFLNWCFRLEILGAGNYLRPSQCEGKYMATLHPESGDATIFWTPQEGSTVFRVLWTDEELTRCEIAAGTCEVYLP